MQDESVVQEVEVGVVMHYWSHLGVAGVHLTAPLDVGDHVHVLGHTTDFEQNVGSMEVEHGPIQHADAGAEVGLRVVDHAREHDRILRAAQSRDTGSLGTEL